MSRLLAPCIVAMLLAAPRLAEACASCVSGRSDENRFAFLITALMLSVMPLAVVGGIAWFVRRRARELASEPEGLARSEP